MPRNILNESQAKRVISLDGDDLDELFQEAVEVVCQYDRASPALIQRRLSVGYARAAKLIDQLEYAKVVGPPEGSKPREVFLSSPKEILNRILKSETKEEEEDYDIGTYKYKQPKLDIIKKSKDSPWKKSLHDVVNDSSFKKSKSLSFPIGYTKEDKLVIESLKEIKHLVIGGNSLSQKEVVLDTILTSLLLKETPSYLKLILIDPVRFLNYYDYLPHLLSPVINDPDKSISAFRWMMSEMDRRLKIFLQAKTRDLGGYNKNADEKLPHILLIINQIEDCLLFSPVETEDAIARILMLAPRTGVHIIFSTNHLTTKIVPATIQSEMPNKIFFRFTSYNDAGPQKVTDVEKLKTGEIIYISENKPLKLDAIYTSEESVKEVVKTITSQK